MLGRVTLDIKKILYSPFNFVFVPHSKSGIVPRSSLLGAGSWGSGKLEGVGQSGKGGANRVSLQAT
jgi:hypothetical protein